jgi:hypothetical protein
MHTQYKEIWPASTAPLSRLSLVSYKKLYNSATTPRPPARHALEDLFDQDSVVGSGGFDSDSDGIGY